MAPELVTPGFLVVLIITFYGGIRAATGATGGVTICSCDLSPGSCDINCCCDPDCSSSDPTNVFSFCLPGSTKAERWSCLPNWLMFRNNAPYSSTVLGAAPAQLLCVSAADASLNYFVTPQKVDAGNFSSVSDPYRGASFSPASARTPAFSSFYQSGDPVLTLSTSNVLGVMRLPGPLGDQRLCTDPNPARFLLDDMTSCVRRFSNLSVSCETDRSLSVLYYQDMAVLRVPADATDLNAIKVPISSSVADVPILQGDVCENVVTQVIYTVLYNGTQGITNVSVDFILSNVSTTSDVISQTFSVLYKPVTLAAQGSVQSRSGNPGYLVGLPVLSDIGRLSLLRSLVGESCSHSDVQFGVNAVSGCVIRGQDQETCADLQARAYQLLLGGRAPGSLAMFGNTTAGQSGDRTSIIYQNCSLQGDCASSCLLPTSLHIQILWASVGLVSNPQSQLLGGRFVFGCESVQCRGATALQTRVSFTDLTRRGPSPRSSRAPLEFFSPFQSSAAEGPAMSLLCLTLGMLLTCL